MNLLTHAWRSVTGNAKRTGLATAPLVLFVAVMLFSVVGAHEGVQSFARRVDDRGAALIVVTAQPRNVTVTQQATLETLQELTDDVRRSLPDIPTTLITESRSPLLSFGRADDRVDSFEIEATLTMVDSQIFSTLALETVAGRRFDAADFELHRNVAVVGSDLAASYGISALDNGPVRLLLDGRPLLVVGILAPSSRRPVVDRSILVPSDATVFDSLDERGVAEQGTSSSALLVGSSITRLGNDAGITSTLSALFSRGDIDVGAEFQANSLRDFESGTHSLVSTISLLQSVAAVGCALAAFQLQSSAARLRHRELGTRLAMGYSPSSIRWMLLLEGLFTLIVVIVMTLPMTVAAAIVVETPTWTVLSTYSASLAVTLSLLILLPQAAVHRALRTNPYDLLVTA